MQKIQPMLISTGKKPFSSSDYIFEWKVDGIRCLAYIDQGQVRLFSRHRKDCTAAFPELWGIGQGIDATSTVLDGELCALIEGKPDLEAIMQRYMTRSPRKVQELMRQLPVTYVVWDILSLNGQDMTKLPLAERKELLKKTVSSANNLQVIDAVDGEGEALFTAIRAQGLEGMVAKEKNSRYLPGERSPKWMKIKNWRETDCYVTGYKLHAPGIYLSIKEGNGVRPAGLATYGMKPEERAALLAVAEEIEVKRDQQAVWLDPVIKCVVKHVGMTSKGNFRDGFFLKFIA